MGDFSPRRKVYGSKQSRIMSVETKQTLHHTRSWLYAIMGMCILTSGLAEAKVNKLPAKRTSEIDSIRGIVKPAVSATISSEIQARISHLPFKDGQRFKKGQTLIKFDCSKYKAELDAALAEYEARQKTLENSLELSKLNAIGQLEVEISKVDVKKAKASINISKVNVQHCRIQAPFSGRIVKTLVNRYESVNPYDELLSILDDNRFEIELILPSASLRWIKKGMTFDFTVDETGKTYQSKVTELGASIDPVSQTIRVSGAFKKKPKSVVSGMSGSATFPKKSNVGNKKKGSGKSSVDRLSKLKAKIRPPRTLAKIKQQMKKKKHKKQVTPKDHDTGNHK